MATLPLNIVFFTSTAGHYGHKDVYQTTIKHYKAKLGGSWDAVQGVYAHVKVRPSEKDQLPDIIDFLLDQDVKPIVTEGDWQRGMSHQNEYLKDLFKVFSREDIHRAPYTFFVEDDSPIKLNRVGDMLYGYLYQGIATLMSNKDVINIRFQREGISTQGRPLNDAYHVVETFDFQPNIGRTRDLWYAAKIIGDHWEQFSKSQCEAAFRVASSSLSHSPARFLSFNPAAVQSYHIGAPDYAEQMKGADFMWAARFEHPQVETTHFSINGLNLRYARESFNEAWANERSVEVALGRWFLNRFPGQPAALLSNPPQPYTENPVLEVGCVLPYYGNDSHEIIDLTDEHPKNRKVNGLDVDYTGRNVLCISTVEHMMTKEYGNGSDADSYTFLTKLVKEADNYLITWGIGYNPHLDAFMVANPQIPRVILRRTNWKNEYVKHHDSNDFSFPFGHSDRPIPQGFFNNANGICVVTNLKELL